MMSEQNGIAFGAQLANALLLRAYALRRVLDGLNGGHGVARFEILLQDFYFWHGFLLTAAELNYEILWHRSSARTEWVSSPTEIASTPVSA